MGKTPQRRDDERQVRSRRGPQGMTWGAIEKGDDGPLPLDFDIAWALILSARSLLISWLPYFPTLISAWNNAGGGCGPVLERAGSLGRIKSKKECIKSSETYCANTLYLNDQGLSMKWVCSPKFYGPLAIWPWLRRSPHSSLYVTYCLIINVWQWLMSFTCIPVQTEPNKSPLRKPFSFERSATFPSQADHVLVDLFSSVVDRGLR